MESESLITLAIRLLNRAVLVTFLMPTLARAQSDPLERGRYLVETVAFCGVCHNARTPQGQIIPGKELSGGRVMSMNEMRIVLSDIPPGEIRAVVPNITPDPETGIGRWTDAEIAAAIRQGRHRDGTTIGPPMPIELYQGLSDHDLTAIIAYLRTIPPVRNAVLQRSAYPFELKSYAPVDHVVDPADNPVARGAYIAGPLAHCVDCHTPAISVVGRDWSQTGAGGIPFEGPWGIVVSRNITPNKERGIGNWTDEQIITALTKGVSADGRRLMPPMGARAPIYARIAESDMRDLIAYLRSLPAL